MTDLPYQIAAALRKSRSVFIACHVAPDGDCLGSALALQLALARIGRTAQVGSADGVPEPFRVLPGAECLLTAVVTDTGSFRYRSTAARSLRLAAGLVDAGASVHQIVERVYETRSAGNLRLLGLALAGLTLTADGRIVWTQITPQMLTSAGAMPDDVTGIVGMLRQIRGVRIALLFEVTPQGVRVGIRSREGARSHVIAEAFGGGGHQEAAGFTASGALDTVTAATLAAAEKELQRAAQPSPPSRP